MKLSDMLDTVGTSPHETLNPSIPQQMKHMRPRKLRGKKEQEKIS